MNDVIAEAVTILSQGGIVIFPTDTAFGIGCALSNEHSIKRLFTLRRRPQTQATPVLVDSIEMAQIILQPIPSDVFEKLMKPFWPGALTIVLKCKTEKVPALVRGGRDTLGVRIPDHPVARSIIRELKEPILGPSANFYGERTPYTISDLDPDLVKKVDFVVPGECILKKASTVIDCSKKPWKILRQGSLQIL